jgi:hypothetical protein
MKILCGALKGCWIQDFPSRDGFARDKNNREPHRANEDNLTGKWDVLVQIKSGKPEASPILTLFFLGNTNE